MPADCACHAEVNEILAKQAAAALILTQVSSSNTDGIVCRIRAAMKLLQVKYPVLLANFKGSKAFQSHQKEIAPLLGCVEDATKPNKACEKYLPPAMAVAGSLMPKLTEMQHAVGKKYQQEISSHC